MSIESYKFGVFLGRHKGIVTLLAAAILIYFLSPSTTETAPKSAAPQAAIAPQPKALEECETDAPGSYTKAQTFMKKGDPDSAFKLLQPCRSTLNPQTKAIYVRALTESNAKRAKIADLEAKRVKVAKKSKGVSIGMSKEDVKSSSWGKPRHINRTVNAYGVSEQWVYDGGYLYFDSEILTAIQN